jgi:hypothetical protein
MIILVPSYVNRLIKAAGYLSVGLKATNLTL